MTIWSFCSLLWTSLTERTCTWAPSNITTAFCCEQKNAGKSADWHLFLKFFSLKAHRGNLLTKEGASGGCNSGNLEMAMF